MKLKRERFDASVDIMEINEFLILHDIQKIDVINITENKDGAYCWLWYWG